MISLERHNDCGMSRILSDMGHRRLVWLGQNAREVKLVYNIEQSLFVFNTEKLWWDHLEWTG